MIVAKFGGTSVADPAAVRRLIEIVVAHREVGIVVVSALSGITDQLLQIAELADAGEVNEARQRIARLKARHRRMVEDLGDAEKDAFDVELERACEPLDRIVRSAATGETIADSDLDAVAAVGELLSSRIVQRALKADGLDAEWVDARKVMVTDDHFGKAVPQFGSTEERLREWVLPLTASGRVVVLGGFIGATPEGVTTTLGRGGSDYSASIIGAALEASEIHIWTDVDGMLTADPRVVPHARLVPHLSFAEASELAYFGAKVLHPSTIMPAMLRGIPVRILNSRRPEAANTLITAHAPESETPLRALACKRDITVIDITSTRMFMAPGFLRRLFEVFERYRTSVDVVTTSEVSVSVTLDDARSVDPIIEELSTFAEVVSERGLALVCAVGERLRSDATLCGRIVTALEGLPLRMISQASSRQNITFVLSEEHLSSAMAQLHRQFFEDIAAPSQVAHACAEVAER